MMFNHLAGLLSQICQFPISPGAPAEGGTAKIMVNPTHLSKLMPLPVEPHKRCFVSFFAHKKGSKEGVRFLPQEDNYCEESVMDLSNIL